MSKLLIISSLLFFSGCWSSKQTRCSYENYLVPQDSIYVECARTNPYNGSDFFGVYIEVGNKLYYLGGRRILEAESCKKAKIKIEKIISKTGKVRVEATDIITPSRSMELDDPQIPLFKKHNMLADNTALYSQISNGKECDCWFEDYDKPCECLSLEGKTYGKDNCTKE